MCLTIHLLGTYDVRLREKPLTNFRSNKARALLAYLAVEANQPISRATLSSLLWGDYPEAQARKSLRNTISNLRQMLSPLIETQNLIIERQSVQLVTDNEHCIVDVAEFEALLTQAKDVLSMDDAIELLQQAVERYNGGLLNGFPVTDSQEFEDWRLLQQEIRHRQMMDALGTLTNHFFTSSERGSRDLAAAAKYARCQIQLEPWQERAHQQLIQILAKQGNRSAAMSQFAALRKVLELELGVEPSPETQALYDKLRLGKVLPAAELRHTAANDLQQPPLAYQQPDQKLTESKTGGNINAAVLTRLEPLPTQTLFGVERAIARLMDVLQAQDRPWLVSINGIGGIGKTTLATLMIHDLLATGRFENIAWISAKQEEFRAAIGLTDTGRPALDADSLTDGLLEQLMEHPPLTASPDEKRAVLMSITREKALLVVVDNLETVTDYQALVPYLRQLANPSKFLITTRFSLQSYSDIFCYSLTELPQADALAFLRYEAEMRNMGRLINASEEQLAEIYRVVGGNPLALKLVIGQVSFLSLSQVLESLREATGKKIDQLYLYIYWQAWGMLDDMARQLFLAMPAVDDGTFMELSFAAALDPDNVQDALSQLMALSLVQVSGELDEPRYHLHRLTETFLMNEVLKWQALQ